MIKLNYLTPPSNTVLVSTISDDNIENLAPFGMFMVASSDENPMLLIGVSPKTDTYENIMNTKNFVIGIPTQRILRQLYKAGDKISPSESEFAYTGLTPKNGSIVSSKLIAECNINFECYLEWEKITGNHCIFCGKVVKIHLPDELLGKNISPIDLRLSIDPIYHITSNNFAIGFEKIVNISEDD